ncbi:MAG: ATP phosphoribosyltransferase [Rhodothermia bacterium]|nr:ATP phosphoribosyltransferase [Rhodothermia bacterium]
MKSTLRLALQKSGRLSDSSARLIEECGIHFNHHNAKLKCTALNFPLEIFFLRDDDIPGYVADGVADLGIVGENVVREKKASIETLERLGFGRCRLSIAVPRGFEYSSLSDLEGLDVATSYPSLLTEYLDSKGVKAEIHVISGSAELAPSIGLADAVCDLVSTGSTLLSNGLKEVETILESQAVLVARPGLSEETQSLVDQLRFRIKSVGRARSYKYILLNVPNESIETVSRILPGMKSPTVMPLAIDGWSSVHSVVQEDEFWVIIDKLRDAGAQGVLVLPVEKMVL